jgi:LuxR family transcriptional activator of bioluminescence operon
MKKIIDAISLISSVNNIEEIGNILQKITLEFDMEYFLLGIATPSSLTRTNIVIEDNFPKKWRDYYDSNSLAKIDPVVSYCLKKHTPIIWSEFSKNNFSLEELHLFKKAKKYGLAYGFSIPIHGSGNQFGMLSMVSSSNKTMNELLESQVMAQSLIPVIQDTFNRLFRPIDTKKPKLTPREVECLQWASEGKSGWDMSQIMGCSERTILFHMNNVRDKLNTNNRTQSIAKAILLGYLEPSLEY